MSLKLDFKELRIYRRAIFITFIFCMMASFSFFATRGMQKSSASIAGFSAGNIISDYMMSNRNAMSLAQIQQFLTSKNPCNDTDYNKYLRLKAAYPSNDWHFENGHFICLSEERFGDGETLGSGQTAAEIIYQAAQDYYINPQVLLVLLQKEQGLITDTYPNKVQYRAATGFGCPDTAPCSVEYYGFKNQVRKAASMFREVLDGGWSNYPAYKTVYVQYNPNAGCGGTNVYIENRATSALYRYTPYQPNASALNAGYGTGDSCGAYGNRNFYLYFTDWFGSTQKDPWTNMNNPRMMMVKKTTYYNSITYDTNASKETLPAGTILFFTVKTMVNNGQCLGVSRDQNICVQLKDLEDVTNPKWGPLNTPRTIYIPESSYAIDYGKGTISVTNERQFIYFTEKVGFANGDSCMRGTDEKVCYLFSSGQELKLSQRQSMNNSRVMLTKKHLKTVAINSQGSAITIQQNQPVFYSSKYILNNNTQCLTNEELDKKGQCVLYDDLYEIPGFTGMNTPRSLFVPAGTTYYDFSNNTTLSTTSAQHYSFAKKVTIAGEEYVQTVSDNGTKKCFRFKDLLESINITKILTERELIVPKNTKYYDFANNTSSFTDADKVLYFTKRAVINGQIYVQSSQDGGTYRLYLFNDLREMPRFVSMDTPRSMQINQGSSYINILTNNPSNTITLKSEPFQFKTYVNGNMCLASSEDIKQYRCVMYDNLTGQKIGDKI